MKTNILAVKLRLQFVIYRIMKAAEGVAELQNKV